MSSTPSPSRASDTSRHSSALTSDRRSPPMNNSEAITASSRPRRCAVVWDSTPRPSVRGRSAVARIAASPSALSGQPLTRPDCGGYPSFFVDRADFQQAGRSLYLYVGTCLLLVRTCGVWSKESAPTCGVWSKRTCGVWSCKTPRNHRILWKSHIEGVERPQEPRTTLAATSQFQTCSQPVHFSEQWWPISWRSLFTVSMTLALLPHKPSG